MHAAARKVFGSLDNEIALYSSRCGEWIGTDSSLLHPSKTLNNVGLSTCHALIEVLTP